MPADKLTPKQRVFCEEFLIDLNGKQAAIRAGYSKKSAAVIASENLIKPNVVDHIQYLMEERSKRTEITADAVLQELAKLGFSNMEDYTTLHDGVLTADLSNVTRDQMAAVQEFTVDTRKDGDDQVEKFRFKLADKKASLDLLGRNLKLFTDRVEHTGLNPNKDLTDEELFLKVTGKEKKREERVTH